MRVLFPFQTQSFKPLLCPHAYAQFMPALVKWGGNSRSVLAHNAIVTIADLLHFLPGAVASAGGAVAMLGSTTTAEAVVGYGGFTLPSAASAALR